MGKPKPLTGPEATCTPFYSKTQPLENGEVHISLLSDGNGDWSRARYVRLRLLGVQGAGRADRRYYTVRDITIGGRCACSGHAHSCRHNVAHGHPECECIHHTCGPNCDHCCPLFNQLPFFPGTSSEANVCQPCQCHGHATECVFNAEVNSLAKSMDTHGRYKGGGVCVNCQKHTTGINCEQCDFGYYRPFGILPDDEKPCHKCECDFYGSTGNCKYDDLDVGLECECKEGYSGYKCDQCSAGYKGYPECQLCPCNRAGTVSMTDCSGVCHCKLNVEGQFCDTCRDGYFSLDSNNPDGCIPCYCSGVSEACQITYIENHVFQTLSEWTVTDMSVSNSVIPTLDTDTGWLTVGNYELPGIESYYWNAPDLYLGNKLKAYGSRLIFRVGWVVMRGDTSGKPTTGPNVIIIGHNGMKIAFDDIAFPQIGDELEIMVPLRENFWYHIPPTVKDIVTRLRRTEYKGELVTRSQFMSVMSNIKHILLRAKFHTDQVEGSLEEVLILIGDGKSEMSVSYVEKCSCPPGYTGLSCELCAFGYVRVFTNTSTHIEQFECLKCDCNGHAETCDLGVAKCSSCEHNTMGVKCERCVSGYYGNPLLGNVNDCKRCACPLLEDGNNFSPSCALDGTHGDKYFCTQCPEGYTGDHCEICDYGFFGEPSRPGSKCEECSCNGAPCDNITGQCLSCPGNTQGFKCDSCKEEHYGIASEKDCKPCDCDKIGSESSYCDPNNGHCICKKRYTGRSCNTCKEGYGNVTAGCLPCSCSKGASSGVCDPISGHCDCLPGVEGFHCEDCQYLHYGFSSKGCLGCNCNERGSEIRSCDIKTGQCRCLPHVVGLTCDRCEPGHWGINSGSGCSRCVCDPVGAERAGEGGLCDQLTGRCLCKAGVTGPACDVCLPGHYGFGDRGCIKCDNCSQGRVCDPDTGRCVCPPLSQGPACRDCRPGSWGLVPNKGCKYCNCSMAGSVTPQCEPASGTCRCNKGYAGPHCDTCAPNHHGYPRCRPCACHVAGTRTEACGDKACSCDQSGQCPCKINVVGQKCDQCKDGTFGLTTESPSGCTQCFCFGRSSHCTQAGLTWGLLRLNTARLLQIRPSVDPDKFDSAISFISISNVGEAPIDLYSEDQELELNVTSGITIIPDTTGNITIGTNYDLAYPLYWKLPDKFNGDRVTSYGGYLKFYVESDGITEKISNSILRQYPLVQLHAQGLLVLEYYEHYSNENSGFYEVRFHESLWTMRNPLTASSQALSSAMEVNRATMMIALQHVDAIYIRGTHYSSPIEAILSHVAMDTAIPIEGHPSYLASSVELCSCPREYNSTSCQDASNGFFIPKYQNIGKPEVSPTQLIGKAEPCQCNGRSETCDKDTGYCTGCREFTGGPKCERCGEGYYGHPQEERGCLACPCPHTARNNAIACNVHPNRVQCHCREGYSGADCSSCAVGWWLGDDGKCRRCECSPGGVVGPRPGGAPHPCHPTTGQCPCLPHVTGMRCDTCITPRHFLHASTCIPCDNCSQTLMDTIELMSYELTRDTDHIQNASIPKPWHALYKLTNKTYDMKLQLDVMLSGIQKVLALPENSFQDLKEQSEDLEYQSSSLGQQWNRTAMEACTLRQDANLLFDNLMSLRKKLENKIGELDYFTRSDTHINVNKAVKEARHMLKKIKELDLSDLMQSADDIFDKANLQSAILSEHIYKLRDHENKISAIKERFDIWYNKADSILEFKENAWDAIDDVEFAIKRFKNTQKNILNKNEQSQAILAEVSKMQDQHLNQESTVLLQECEDDILNLKTLGPLLEYLANQTDEKEGILNRVNPEYQEKYLEPAMKHANQLTKLAESFKNLFTETRDSADSAVTASTAFKDIVQGINAAREASLQAVEAAELAKKAAAGENLPQDLQNTLLEMSEMSKESSLKHLESGIQHTLRVKEMAAELEKSNQKADRIRVAIRAIAWIDKDLNVLTSNLSAISVNEQLAVANNKSDRVYENMRVLYKEADSIHKDVLYKLRMKLQDLQSNGDDKIGGAEEKVSDLRGNIRRASELALSLMDAKQLREAEVRKSNSTLAEKLQKLRDQIQRAKHAADGIRVSLKSSMEQGCLRSYRLTNLAPSTTTHLSASISLTPDNAQDSVLFHLPSTINGDFVKLELVNKKIRFSWNLGGNTAYITHPEILETFSDSTSDYSWYRVDADRVWNIGKLWVRKVVTSPESAFLAQVPASNTSNPAFGILDVKPGDLAWIGSLATQVQKNAGLAGCLHQLSYNGKQIGLWNFHSQPNRNACTGCIEGAEEIKVSEQNMYYWNGAGYSVLKRSGLRPFNKNQFSILLTFRTFDENALLFLAVDEVNNRSVSLHLREGRVVFRIDYAGDSRLEINTTEKFNTGKFVQVQAARVFIKRKIEKGSLKVDGYEQLGSPNPPVIHSTSIPDLTNSEYLLGGTPPLWRAPSIIRSLPPPFLGCLGDLTIDQEGYNPLDTTVHYGVESTCSDKPLTSVGFYGDGFLELPGHTLRRKSHLGFMFRTLQPNAFLLLSAPRHYHIMRTNEVIPEYAYTTESELISIEENAHNNDGFYSFSLVDGQIHLLMNAGKGDLKLVSNGTALNDGQFHALSVIKKNRRIEMFIDDIAQAVGTLPPGSVVVHAIPQSVEGNASGGMFLGGVPEHLNETDVTDQHIASTISLRGAIKDIVFDGSLISIQDVVSMNHALIGHLGPPMGEEYEVGANLLNTQQSESDINKTSKGCHKVYSYTLEPGAVKFGDVSNSYAQVHLTRRNIWHQDFVLEFDFRTFYPNGLLFLTPGTKEKQRHLIAVYLKDGKVTMTMKGRRKLELSIPMVTNDGQWHHVLVRSTQRRLSITVGPRSALTRMPKVLFLSNMLYVGGLPDKTVTINIPDHMLKMEGFKGCIRRLTVNGKSEDLVKDAALHQNVGQCFPTIERGSYFPGDAYAIYKRQFVIGSHLELQLEFRTVEMNGVLLSIAHTIHNAPALSLELNNAKVVLSVLTISGRRFSVETSLPTQFGLCDNTWHNISALFSAGELTVRVDQLPEETDVGGGPGNTPTTPPSINQPLQQSPLYIGGLPDGAPTGTLTTKENFKGCIRNVSIRGHRKDWTDMDYLHNLLLTSCPVQ